MKTSSGWPLRGRMMDQQRQDYIYIIADKVDALEAKFAE
jgi:hypothetical protein